VAFWIRNCHINSRQRGLKPGWSGCIFTPLTKWARPSSFSSMMLKTDTTLFVLYIDIGCNLLWNTTRSSLVVFVIYMVYFSWYHIPFLGEREGVGRRFFCLITYTTHRCCDWKNSTRSSTEKCTNDATLPWLVHKNLHSPLLLGFVLYVNIYFCSLFFVARCRFAWI
jgi:hypothetical protein